MTARGAVIAMFSLFFLGMLAAGWLHLGSLVGLSFVAGCVLTARYTRRDGLLTAVLTPPLIFMIALAGTQTMSAHADTLRRTLTSAVEGIVLTLASVAPWLFSGVILGIVVALFGGLPRRVSELRAELRAGASPRPEPPIRKWGPRGSPRSSGASRPGPRAGLPRAGDARRAARSGTATR